MCLQISLTMPAVTGGEELATVEGVQDETDRYPLPC